MCIRDSTTSDHHAVERIDDPLEVLHRLRLLYLGDHGQPNALFVHDLVDSFDVFGVAYEGQGDHVRAPPQGPAKIRLVLLRHGRHADRHTGQVDALVVGHDAALHHQGDDVGVRDLDGPQRHLAVIDQQPIARLDVARKPLVGRRHTVLATEDVIDGDGEAFAVDQRDRAIGESAGADLGALQVDQYADGPA